MPAFVSWYIRRRDEAAVKAPHRQVSAADRRRNFERFGDNPQAFAVVADQRLQSFGDESGMIAYDRKMGTVFALADPLAGEADTPALIDDFIETFGDPVFAACTERTARVLSERGYLINVLGHDTVIDLASYSFSGGEQKRLRYSLGWLERRGATVTELPSRNVDQEEIREVSRTWRQTRVSVKEISFLNRELRAEPHPLVRRFYAVLEDGSVLGFVEYDPIFRGGHLIGYLASLKRRISDDTAYLDLAIMGHAIRTFQAEGVGQLHLGLSPLSRVTSPEFGRECRWLRYVSVNAFKSDFVNDRFYSFRGLAQYKERFRGRHEPLYICMPKRGSNLMRMAAFLILTRIV